MDLVSFAKKSIPKPDRKAIIRHQDGNTQDIIDTILYADSRVSNYMCSFAQSFEKSYSGLYEIWNFVNTQIRYVADSPGHERVKDPRVTWADKTGDCKSFSLFIGSLLKCLNIPYRYRFVSYDKSNDPTHVYVIASLNGRDVILDATIEKFDFEVAYQKKWDKMTKISYLHGTPAPAVHTGRAKPSSAQRIADAPRIRTAKPYIDYLNLTEGELTLKLLDEQARILSNYYGDSNGTYQKARNLIYNASKNLHRISGHVGYVDESLYSLMAYLEHAKTRSKPAGIVGSRISGFEEDRQAITTYCKFVKGEFSKYYASFKNGKYTYQPIKQDGSSWNPADLIKEKNKCGDQLFFMEAFNKHLEGSSPHVLYEFIPDSERNSLPNRASFKAENHRLANDSMARNSQLDRTNIVLWERNGIMRAATAKGLPDITPEGFIAEWKKGQSSVTGPHIGIAFAALVPIIAEAVAAAAGLLSLILTARATFASEIKGYGSEGFGPQNGDFLEKIITEKKTESFDFTTILPFAGLALGGMLLLDSK